jgi:hypothetical protein
LLKSMNDQVLEFVKATGATQVVDRTGVAQLMLSVDRSFIKLEAMVAKTQTSVMSALDGRAASKNQHSVSPEELAIAAVRLSRPYLRLGTDLAQTNYGGRLGVPVSLGDLISPQAVESIARSLEELENVAANVERTTRKVLTHSTLGLGDGVNVRMGKPQMGKPQMGKPQMGKPQMGKPQMGKPQMGALARLTATESDSLSQPDGVSAIELFGQAAAALKLLEEAIAEIERDVRLFLTNPPLGRNGDGADYKRRSIEQVELSFRALNEVVANAKDTVFRIVADPSQGLGPTPEQSSVGFDRQNLALAGGLSALDLTLL